MMDDIKDFRNINRLSRFLTLILRHNPDLLQLNIDSEGWTSTTIESIADVISKKEGLNWVTTASIEKIVETDEKGRYQMKNSHIRATYGHSIKVNPLESPDSVENLPDTLFYGANDYELNDLLKLGIIPGNQDRGNFLHLSIRKNDALNVARYHYSQPRIIKIAVRLAHASGVRFKKVSPFIVLTDEVPSQFLESIPLPQYLKNYNGHKISKRNKYERKSQNKDFTNKSVTNQQPAQNLSKKSSTTVYFEIDEDL